MIDTIQPTIIPRAEHSISRNDIHRNALKVLYRLHNAGYSAYLVGGCVRDLLLGRHPKDFDIATNALPDDIRRLFKNCRLIGKRFRLAHIFFGKDIIEVATFRTHHENAEHEQAKTDQGMIIRDNVYGAIEDDVWRRDFTINGLYYNIADFSVVDYIEGMKDIQLRTLRMIGEPEKRYQEDPVRLLRAIRFMGKLDLAIDELTEKPILQLKHLLQKVSSARLFLEVIKLFQEGAMEPTFQLLIKYNLFNELFPSTNACLHNPVCINFLKEALEDTDKRIQQNKNISPAFIFAVFLWPVVLRNLELQEHKKLPLYVSYERAIQDAVKEQTERLAIPRNFLIIIREICILQFRFTQRFGNRPHRLVTHPRFRAAYDLMMLRARSGESLADLGAWWTSFYDANEQQRETMLKEFDQKASFKKKRKKKSIKKTKTPDASA